METVRESFLRLGQVAIRQGAGMMMTPDQQHYLASEIGFTEHAQYGKYHLTYEQLKRAMAAVRQKA